MKIHGVGDGCTVELYTASYTGKLLYNSRNGPIQRTRLYHGPVALYSYTARAYTAALYRIQPIHYTALYADPLRAVGRLKRENNVQCGSKFPVTPECSEQSGPEHCSGMF